MPELTIEERREKALRSIRSTCDSDEEATAQWEDLCRKNGLLPKPTDAEKAPKPKAK